MGLIGPQFVGGTGALAFLLAAEVAASTAVVSEAALIYIARIRNLWISLGTIALQAVLTYTFVLAARDAPSWDLPGALAIDPHKVSYYQAGAVAAALMVSLACASLVKAWVLGILLDDRINNWRWPLVWAAIPAGLVGWAATHYLPEWAELSLGIPAILLTYGYIIWTRGFGPEDRVLFRKNVGA